VLTLGVPIPLHLKNTNKIASGIAAIDMYADPTIQSTLVLGAYDITKFRNKTE